MRYVRRLLMLSAAIIVLLVSATPATSAENGAADDSGSGVEAYGYVSDVSNPAGNIPLPGVEVSLHDKELVQISATTTDDTGMFSFNCEKGERYYLSFSMEGYAVRNVNLPGSTDDGPEGMYSFIVTDALLQTDKGYALTGTATSAYAVAMAITNGIIYGNVYGTNDSTDPFAVNGARVTATSADGRSYSTTTDSDGYFQMAVAYGSYTVKVTCTGFHDAEPVETSTSEASAISIRLTEKEMSLGLFGDLDAPHSLLVIGMIILAMVLVFSFLAYKRSQRPDSEISIVDELPPADEDDVKRP